MELIFENAQQLTSGESPDIIQLSDTSAKLFKIVGGELHSTFIDAVDGDFSNPILSTSEKVSASDNITHLSINSLGGFGGVGCFKAGDTHKLLLYEYQEFAKTISDLNRLGW